MASPELNEMRMQRVLHHFSQREYPIAMITAFRNETKSDNVKNLIYLASVLKRKGYGYVYVDGRWREKGATNPEDDNETSVFVTGNNIKDPSKTSKDFFELMKSICKKYNQDAFSYRGPETNWDIAFVDRNGNYDKSDTYKDISVKVMKKDDLAKWITKKALNSEYGFGSTGMRKGSHKDMIYTFV